MVSYLGTKRFDDILSNYLSSCDSINKYNVKTLYELPFIREVILHFPLKELNEAINSYSKNEISDNLKIKSVLIFYLIFAFIPYINCSKIEFKKHFEKGNFSDNFAIKVCISDYRDINSFLINLFVEHFDILKQENLLLLKGQLTKFVFKNNTFCYNFSIPSKCLFELDEFFVHGRKETGLNEFKIKTSFIVDSSLNIKDMNSLLQNISTFWINN